MLHEISSFFSEIQHEISLPHLLGVLSGALNCTIRPEREKLLIFYITQCLVYLDPTLI